jgi:ATP-dependent DNA helicase RecG
MTTAEQLHAWMDDREAEHLEFKEARRNYDFDDLVKYCVALANEGGGRLVLGVTNLFPRRVVGSQAFRDLESTKAGLIQQLRIRIAIDVVQHPDGRVVVLHVPSRPIGVPLHHKGTYLMRVGESLVPMTPEVLRRIFNEAGPDFSAEVCPGAGMGDLDPAAIARFRNMWQRKSGNVALQALTDAQLLSDAELLVDGSLLYATLVLFGTRQALGKYLL